MPVRGDFAKLGLLQAHLRRLGEVPRETARDAAKAINLEIRKQFLQGRDPYGRPWAPLAPATYKKGRGAPPLTDTGALRDGTRAVARSVGIEVSIGRPEGFFHQVGTKRMPARPILPNAGFPKRWRQILEEAAAAVTRRKLSA